MNGRRVKVSGRGVYGRVVPLKPPRRKGWRLPQFGRTVWRGIGVVAVAGILVWSVAAFFAISDIRVQSNSGQERIREEARQLVGASFWRANVLLVDTDALKSQLLQVDPALKSVEISRQLPHTLQIVVTLKQPSLAWSSGNQIYVLDADGTVIGGLTPGSTLPVVIDGSNVPVKVGERAASRRFVDFVSALMPALGSRGVLATKLAIGDTTLDLMVETTKGYRLELDTGRGVAEAMADFDAVIRTMAVQKKSASEYIDLRIAGKAYYK